MAPQNVPRALDQAIGKIDLRSREPAHSLLHSRLIFQKQFRRIEKLLQAENQLGFIDMVLAAQNPDELNQADERHKSWAMRA